MLRMLAATPKSPRLRYLRLCTTDAWQHTHCFYAVCEFGRQDQDHLQLTARNDA